MKILPLIGCFFLAACAAKPLAAPAPAQPPFSPLPAGLPAAPAPALTPEQIQAAEALRAEAIQLLYSKDPAVKNPRLAFEKFLAAAEIGDPISMDHVGGFHSTGLAGVEKSCPKALGWFEKSAQAGYPMAMNNLAYTLVTCPDQKLRDPEKAEDLLKFLFLNSEGYFAWLDTYAAVLAAQGRFTQAARTLDVVIDLVSLVGGNPERIDEMKKTRAAYRKKKTLADPSHSDRKNFKKPSVQ